MKTKKKTGEKDLDSVIAGGAASVEDNSQQGRGRPKSKVPKKQCPFYLPENIVDAIDENCRGNKSVFAEEVFKFYFDAKGIEY